MNALLLDQVIWVALSVGIAILAGVLHAYAELIYQRDPLQTKWWHFLRNRWFNDTIRLLYATSIPAIALFTQGVLTYRGLGFKQFPWSPSVTDSQTLWLTWQNDIEKTLVIIAVTWIILVLGLRSATETRKYPGSGLVSAILSAIHESVIDQVHWAFYREMCIIIWGISSGSWIVMVPLALELLLNPATWTRIKNQIGVNSLVVNSGILFASTMLYIQTQNLWLMLFMEFALRMLFARIFDASKRL